MAVVPDSHDFTGGTATSSEANSYIRDPIQFVLNKPAARLRQASAQTFGSSVWESLDFETEDLDDNPAGTAQHDTVTNNPRFTAVYAGWYLVNGGITFTSLATPAGRRGLRWMVNGTLLNGSLVLFQTAATTSGSLAARSILVFLNVGDYLELQGFFEGGGTLATSVTTHEHPTMDVTWERNA